MLKREDVNKVELGMKVYHDGIYNGKEQMKVVGIRESEVELEGDYSGGTHNVYQKSWITIKGLFRLRKVCEQHEKYGTCQLPNIYCRYPECESYV